MRALINKLHLSPVIYVYVHCIFKDKRLSIYYLSKSNWYINLIYYYLYDIKLSKSSASATHSANLATETW